MKGTCINIPAHARLLVHIPIQLGIKTRRRSHSGGCLGLSPSQLSRDQWPPSFRNCSDEACTFFILLMQHRCFDIGHSSAGQARSQGGSITALLPASSTSSLGHGCFRWSRHSQVSEQTGHTFGAFHVGDGGSFRARTPAPAMGKIHFKHTWTM